MPQTQPDAKEDVSSPDIAPSPLAFSFPLMTPRLDTTPSKTSNGKNPAGNNRETSAFPENNSYPVAYPGSTTLSGDMSLEVPLPKMSAMPRTPSAQHKQMRKFARSADKRQSVHMLGSIQHLQKHFMKFGLAAEEGSEAIESDIGSFSSRSLNRTKLANALNNPADGNNAESPATVAQPPFPLETSKLDPGKLQREAFESLQALEETWRIDNKGEQAHDASSYRKQEEDEGIGPPTKILDLLKTTIDAVRAVRAWSLAVPATSLTRYSATRQYDHIRAANTPAKPRIPTISTPSRPAPPNPSSRSVSGTSIRLAGKNADGEAMLGGGEEKDPLSDLRKAALDVLACLRGVEEKFRMSSDDSADNSFEDPPHEEEPQGRSTSVSPKRHQQQEFSPPKGPSERPAMEPSTISTQRIEESEDLWFFSQRAGDCSPSAEWSEEEKKGSWYDRLTSGVAGWSYRPDVRVGSELQEEQEVVERYLVTVVETFFSGMEGTTEVPWRRMTNDEDEKLAKVALGDEVDDDSGLASRTSTEARVKSLPMWSDSQLWESRRIGRLHIFSTAMYIIALADADDSPFSLHFPICAISTERIQEFLKDHLPSNMLDSLQVAGSEDMRIKLLGRLSDGYLLALAFNTVLRCSATGSWGFIPDEDLYDTLDSGGTTTADSSYVEGETSARRQKDWTFRKAGNLRCWGAALKLRYSVPLTFPIQAVELQLVIPVIQTTETGTRSLTASRQPTPSSSRRASEHTYGKTRGGSEEGNGAGIPFDPVRIARRNEGWDGMLEAAVVAWVDKVSLELLSVTK
ncbi:hypothetical protein QFC21_003996 [Naganishia friedmannii]|uniref:Uncharacterized protein n=1 Tax=Naganishia friedmannii TaxID=89922 RepID=A0ACC2VJL9_9TREE|nr:hypothetical protein QFC21_003996 [Naganishia friedmannii]